MTRNEKRYLAVLSTLGLLALTFILVQIGRALLVGPEAPPTAMVLAATTEPASPTTVLGNSEASPVFASPTSAPPSATTDPSLPTNTPVIAVGVNTATPSPEPTAIPIYVVQSGDTLFGLALRYDVTVDDIKGVNGLTDNLIYVGQELIIPAPGLVIPTRTPGAPPPPAPTLAPGVAATATRPAAVGGTFGAAPIPGPSPTWSVYAFPTRFPASGPTKLGFHVTLNCCGVLDYVAAVKPPVIKGVDDIGFLKDVKALSPNTITIGRYVVPQENIGSGDAAQRAIDFVNQYLPKYMEHSAYVNYWEGWNEVTYPNYEWYAQFEAARACEMQKHGLKAAIGGFSTGTPEPWQFEAFLPAIEAGIRCGAILTTHEYGAPTLYLWFSQGLPASLGHPEMPAYPDRGPLMGRYRYLYYNVLLPRGLNIPLVISETGIDGGAGAGQRPGYSSAQGWLGFHDYWGNELGVTDPVGFYVEQLAWYDSMLRQDSFVIGATIFNAGANATWQSFDVTTLIPRLTEYALTLK